MGPIPPSLHPPIFIIVVAIGAYFAQRKSGWQGLVIVWLASTVLATGFYVTWYSLVSPLSPRETLTHAVSVALVFLMVFLIISGGVVWGVAIFVRPPTEPEHFPPMAPSQRANDPRALVSIPWRYQKLLEDYADARQKAVFRPSFRVYFPSYQRQSWRLARQDWRVPHVIMRSFVAAEPVLTELEEMTTTQLSTLDAYHQMNLRRLKERHKLKDWSLLAALPAVGSAYTALIGLTTDLEQQGILPNMQWDIHGARILAFVTQHPNWIIISSLILGAVLVIMVSHIATWSMQRDLEDFGNLLGLALTYRHQKSTTAPSSTGTRPGVPGNPGAVSSDAIGP